MIQLLLVMSIATGWKQGNSVAEYEAASTGHGVEKQLAGMCSSLCLDVQAAWSGVVGANYRWIINGLLTTQQDDMPTPAFPAADAPGVLCLNNAAGRKPLRRADL